MCRFMLKVNIDPSFISFYLLYQLGIASYSMKNWLMSLLYLNLLKIWNLLTYHLRKQYCENRLKYILNLNFVVLFIWNLSLIQRRDEAKQKLTWTSFFHFINSWQIFNRQVISFSFVLVHFMLTHTNLLENKNMQS